MILERLTVHRMPGISDRFTVEATPGLNLITGPNGSGKTSVCRAVRALLWPSTETPERLEVTSRWTIEGASFGAEREGGGETRWSNADGQPAERPALPAGHLAHCYTLNLHHLFRAEGEATDAKITEEILRQMTGGYDLDAVLEKHFHVTAQAGRTEQREFAAREAKLLKLRRQRGRLAEQQDSLRDKEAALESARTARDIKELLSRRKDVLETTQALERAVILVESFEAEKIHRLTGREVEDLDELESDIASTKKSQNECQHAIEEAQDGIERANLPGGRVVATELEAARTRSRKLTELESDLRQAEKDEARARRKLETLGQELDPDWSFEDPPDPGIQAIRDAETHCRRVAECERQIEVLDRILDHQLLALEAPGRDPSELERGVRALEDWVAVPARTWLRALPALFFVLCAAGAVAGWVLASPREPAGWIPFAAIVLAAGIGLWLALARPLKDRRTAAHHREQFERTGLTAPADWSETAVRDRLDTLRQEWIRTRVDRIRSELADGFDAERKRAVRERDEELPGERAALLERTGAAPDASAIEIVEFARRLHAYREADRELAAHVETCRHLESKIKEARDAINAFCGDHGYPDAADAAGATAHVEDLAERTRRLENAESILRREEPRLGNLTERLQDRENKKERLFTDLDLGPGDRAGLIARVGRRPKYLEAADQHRTLQTKLDLQQRSLEEHPWFGRYPDLDTVGLPELESRIESLASEAAGLDALAGEIHEIRTEVRLAEASHDVEGALSRVGEARDVLAEKREEALFSEAGRFLLEGVRDRYEAATRPDVEVRASDLFLRFTNDAYRFRVVRGDGGKAELRAIDTREQTPLRLEQLSDGTRAQLLLAARLAFAFESEREMKPPLFLDEALSTSDPERFHAIARNLVELTREDGRQVFYLTANPADVRLWNRTLREMDQDAVTPFDLGEGRRKAVAAGSEELTAPPLRVVPDPTGMDAEAYGRALQVERFDPRRETASVHLFHLLSDDLDLLHRLLVLRIETVGQWQDSVRRMVRPPGIDEETARRIDACASVVDAFITAWREGRGKPVCRETLEASEAVSDKFLDEVADLARELEGAGVRLVEELEKGTVKKFRRKTAQKLRDYLQDNGYIDPRPKLDEDGIRARVLAAVRRDLASGALAPARAVELIHRLWRLAP